MVSAVKNIQYLLSHDDWQDFPLEAVDGRAAWFRDISAPDKLGPWQTRPLTNAAPSKLGP